MRLPYDDPGTPDLRSPRHLLGWVGRGQWRTLASPSSSASPGWSRQALFPAAMGRAIDQGIVAARRRDLASGARVLRRAGRRQRRLPGCCGTGTPSTTGCGRAFRAVQLLGWHSAGVGEALPRTVPTGEVVATVASDAMRIGGLLRRHRPVRRAPSSLRRGRRRSCCTPRVPSGWSCSSACRCWCVPRASSCGRCSGARPTSARSPAGSSASAPTPSPGCACCAASVASRPSSRRYAAQSQSVRAGRLPGGRRAGGARRGPGAAARHLRASSSPGSAPGSRSRARSRAGELVAFYGYTAFLVMPLRTAIEIVDRLDPRATSARSKIIAVLRGRAGPRRAPRTRPAAAARTARRSSTRSAASASSRAS